MAEKAHKELSGPLSDRFRALVLEQAIQGKLAPQIDSEPAVEQIGDAPEDVPFTIPEKWKWVTLKAVCSDFLVPMRDKPNFSGNVTDTPWCRIEDIEGMFIHGSKSGRYVSKDTIDSMCLKVNPVNSVISACSASIGAAAIVTNPLCTNQTFIGLVCKESILFNKYLYYFLKASKKELFKIGSGTTIKYISRKKYEEFLIPLPPIDEQRRIVARVEALLKEVDAIAR